MLLNQFNECINMLAEDVRGLQAERDEKESKTLNRIMLCLTFVFGVSTISDISGFTALVPTSLTPSIQTGLLVAILGLISLLIMWLWHRYRLRRPKRPQDV